MTTTILGIDASPTATGLGRLRPAVEGWQAACHTFTPEEWRTTPEDRWDHIVRGILGSLTDNTLAVLEGVFKGKNIRTTIDLAMLHGVIRRELHRRRVPVVVVVPQHLKQFATGNGNAGKPLMVATARQVLYPGVGDDNQADGLWLAAMAAHRYGRPLTARTATQTAVLSNVDWPAFTIGDAS